MQVTFTKTDGKRYAVAIRREHGPSLLPRFAPGYDDRMPHDLAHYLVEEHFQIELGVWGQLAAGGGGIFTPAPDDNTLTVQRRAQRIGAIGRADMARSEQLVVITVAAWERTIDRVKHQAWPYATEVDDEELRGAVRRMGGVADRWHSLPYGRSITFTWPRELTFNAAKCRRGRRASPRSSALGRREQTS
jgi:hypothetical protein